MDNRNGTNSNQPQLGSLLELLNQSVTTTPRVDETLDRFDKLDERFKLFENALTKSQKEVADLKTELKDSKKDYIIFLGLFASLIAYLTIEIQILKNVTDFFLLLGLSTFLLSGLLLFSLSLNHLVKESTSWKELGNPVFIIILVLAIISSFCFYKHFDNTTQYFSDVTHNSNIAPETTKNIPSKLSRQNKNKSE
jgi:hypothetical protein